MPNEIKKFDSVGGFSVDRTEVLDQQRNAKNFNTLQVKNTFFQDATKTNYILRGLDGNILAINNVGNLITLASSTINFITAHIVAVNNTGSGNYSVKIESAVDCNASGNVTVLSSMTTVIKDNIPTGQTWTIVPYDSGANNRFSYDAGRQGTFDTIKWTASVEVISISW